MNVTFELNDSKLFFDDRRPDRVVFVSRFDKPLDISLEQLIEILNKVAAERREWRKEFGNIRESGR